MPVFAINKTLAAIQSLSQSGTQENADAVAGLIGVSLVNNAPDMDEKLLSDNYRDENYRYQDVGYIAGSRKELAQSAIMQAKKLGQLVQINDIDWDELESDPRIAAATITKKNVFGKVDWDGLKAGGMNGNTAYFIKRLYAAIEMQPDVDSPEDRKLYVTAIQTLRDTFESCITMDDATKKIVELSKLLNARKNMIRDDKGELVLNYDAKVAFALGRKFRSWVFNTGNKAIHESVFKMNTKDWSWLEGAEKTASAKPKKASFQLEAAIDCKRVGGAQVSITSTEQFKSVFGLKAVQSGKWVLSDKESIEFHIQRSAESMSDMADITGIPVEMLGFGGRLGLAFGARGKGGALAHYEPTQRVINITKMKGGGSLGHEYFHALDNLMQDLMTQTTNGKADFMATETPEGLPDSPVKASFVALRMAMLIGGTSLTESLKLTDKDFEAVEKGMIPRRIANSEMKQAIVAAGNVFDAVKAVDSYFNGPRMTHPSQKRKFRDKYHMESIRLAAAYYSEKGTDSVKIPSFGKLGSTFLQNSIMLDDDKQGKYWSKPLEMAARAFSAYLQDKLEEQGRVNDYLAYSTKGGNGRVGQEAYPEGEERKAINAAFDQLFKSLKDGQIFEKALGNIGLMDSMFPNFDSMGEGDKTMINIVYAIQDLAANSSEANAKKVADLLGVNLGSKIQPSKYIKLDLSGSYDVDLHNDVFNAMNNGKLSIEDYKAAFEHLIADLPQFAEDLGKKTKSVLLNMGGPFFESRYRSDKKDEVRDALIDKFIKNYVIASSFSYSPSFGGRDKYLQSLIRPVRAKVDATTQEALDEHALQIKTARDEKAAAMIERAKGTENPQSLEDFRNIIRNSLQQQMTAAGVDQRTNEMLQNARMSMTVEQRAKYDELEAIESRTKRMGNSEPKPVTVQSASQSVSGTITETAHTKKGHALFVVQLSERLDKDDYSRVNAAAKNLGGYYSSYRGGGAVVGFQFTTMENAQAFLALAGGDTALAQAAVDAKRDAFADDKTQSSVTRLKEMSARLNARAVESLGQDRLANTARRARFAASAEAAANADKALAATMLNIAVAQESGQAIFLNKVRQKAQVELLQGIVRTAKDAELHKKYPSYGDYLKHIGEAPTIETADSAAYPYYQAYRSDLADIARKLILVEGTKMIGQRLLKNVDDVTDAYLKFAKENIGKLNVYRKSNDSSLAAFTKKADAERAIEHSGFNGKAIVLNVAKGEWLIIPSPSEAMKLGLWKGDDKLIILSPEFGSELVEKIGAINRKKANVALPWQLESAHERRQKLSALGIETPAEYRTMLREFIGLIQTPEVPSKIKEMERAMVGRRNDGLDFFPTPEKVVSQMIDAADIQEGMRVLEPSAGMGHIADVLREQGIETDVAEISPDRRELLKEKGYAVIGQDFMDMDSRTTFTYGDVFKDENGRLGIMRGGGSLGSGRVRFFLLDENGKEKENSGEWMSRDELIGVEHRGVDSGYDRIIMNPPFSDRRDIAHVMHAYNLLKVGGKLVAIMGEGAFFGSDKKATEFRDWLDEVGGSSEKLDEGSFNDPTLPVTTNANTRMVVIVRGKEQKAGFDSIDDQAHESATSPHNDIPEPTLAQKIAGNYKVGKITISGLSISIENPKGSTRSGVDADGNEWSNVMKHHYGFIRGSHGADGDHVDVFVKPNTSENFNGNVYVIDQKDPLTGKFDEHKAIIGAISEADAKAIYLANYEKDWQGLAAITALPMAAFKPWVLSSEAKKPLAIFDSLNGNTSLMDALALITSLSKKKSEAVAQQLAVAIGVSIVNPSPTDLSQDQALDNLVWLDNANPVSTMKGDEVPRFEKVKLLTEWVGEYWEKETGGKVNRADLGDIVVDKVAAKNSAYHGMNKAKASAFYLVPNALKNGVLLGKLPTESGKVSAFIVAAPVSIGDNVYRLLMEVRSDENMQRLYVHEVVLRNNEAPLSEFKTAAASQKEAEPHSPPRGAIYNFMLNLRKIQAEKTSQDFTLSTYTESDLRAQEAVLKAAEAKRQADEKAAKDKAIADKQVGDFRLSGSSMPSDVAASYGQNDMFVQTRGQQVEKPVTDNTKDQPKPKKKIRTYGFNRFLMSQNLTNEELEILAEITRLKHRTNKNGFYLYDKRGVKKLDDLSWVVTWRMKNNDEAKFGKMLDTEDIMRIRDEVRKDYEIGLFDDKDSPQYDDLGGFTFTPVIALDQTLDAIAALASNNSQANAERLSQLLGVKLAPKQELDMFGEPIQHQELDMFGDPIQDGEDSPVEDLPRLAVVELPLSKLTLSEDVPQFKSGADDESGVVEALGGKFDRTGVAPIQIWERTDGRLEIISGRHRTDLARRSGEKTIPAQVHKESEGFTAKQAMMLDAELNIRDGQGKVKDYVDYFTHSEISEDEADKRGLLARSIGQRAFVIASKGSDELKTLHRNEIISDQAAADVATLAPSNSAMQAVGLRVLQEHKPLNNALNTMRAVMALTREKGQEPDTFDLFGFDDSALKEAEAMAKIASRKQRQIGEQLTAIKGAVKNPKAAAKHGVIVENQADALEKVKTMTALKSRWDNWSSHADLLAEVRQEIAEKGGYDSVMSEDDYFDEYDSLAMPSMTDYDVVDVDTIEIKLNPLAYQWRNNVTGDGTEKGRVVSGTFNYDSQPPLILHRRLSGRIYLADGHHRYKMAKASHAPIVKAIVLDEHDGYTVPAMRVLCGFLNLRKEALVKDRVQLPMVNMAKTADLIRKSVESEMGW